MFVLKPHWSYCPKRSMHIFSLPKVFGNSWVISIGSNLFIYIFFLFFPFRIASYTKIIDEITKKHKVTYQWKISAKSLSIRGRTKSVAKAKPKLETAIAEAISSIWF